MKWLLIAVFLSSGTYRETHLDEQSCREAMIEAKLFKSTDVWSLACIGPDNQIITTVQRDFGP